ncbi:MAG: hypothetical protein RL079_828 [Verrucomicrobiota bacterium]|jgi:hypothetical protein
MEYRVWVRIAGDGWVGAPLRGVRGRTDMIWSHILPDSAGLGWRTGATQSRPYLKMHPNKKAAHPGGL